MFEKIALGQVYEQVLAGFLARHYSTNAQYLSVTTQVMRNALSN
jgi:hypothetical protein